MAVILKCPECREKFRWEFAEERRWPKACPCCGVSMGTDDDDTVICMPSLRSAKTASTDKLYRDMEAGSEFRAQKAAEDLGVSVSDVSDLKITNMRDNLKTGELAAMPATAEQSRLEAAGSKVQFMPNGSEYASAVRSGPHPNAGAKALGALQRLTGKGA